MRTGDGAFIQSRLKLLSLLLTERLGARAEEDLAKRAIFPSLQDSPTWGEGEGERAFLTQAKPETELGRKLL